VSAELGSLSGERRPVTALFYDIVGSTELLHQHDAEDFGRVQRLMHNEATAAVRAHGGYCDRVQGDGGSAYFGLPVSSEDAAECAVAAALEMVERCRKLEVQPGPWLRLRVGVATGFVVVADVSDSRLPFDTEIIGIAPALAARIQAEAEPNGVAVADATYRLTHGAFEFRLLGKRLLKGFPEPVLLWEPLARRPPGDRFTTYRRASAPLIGRAEELKICRDAWRKAKSGRGQVIFLHGEAGIGKSRLVAELRSEIAESISFQCSPRGDTRPLHAFVDRLRQDVTTGTSSVAMSSDSIADCLGAQGVTLGEDDTAALAFLCGRDASAASATWSADLSSEEVRTRMLSAVLKWISELSRTRPRLVGIEDVHWADTLTHAVLLDLPKWVEAIGTLVVVTSREGAPPEFASQANVQDLPLPGLGPAAIGELIDSVWGGSPPNKLSDFVSARSDGIPLFAEELALLVKERFGTTPSIAGDWDAILQEGGILTLQDLIAARLSGLGEVRRVAQVASVIGREFETELLSSLVEPDQAPGLEDALQALMRSEILEPIANAQGALYRFRHGLVHEAAYESLLKADRRRLHACIVDLVRSGTAPALPDELLAWHCAQGDRPAEAVDHAIRAAEACVVRSAVQEADRLLAFARKQLDRCDTSTPNRDDLRLRLFTTQGPVAAALFGRGAPETRSIYEEGVALCALHPDEDHARWFPLYWGWWFTAIDYQSQRARSDVLLRDLETSSDPEVRLQALHCAWATSIDAGRHAHCLDCVERGLHLYDEDRARVSRGRYGGHDAKVCGLGERAFSLWFMGNEVGSVESMNAAMAWARRLDHLSSMLHALEFDIELKFYRNDPPGVIAATEELDRLALALPGVLAKSALFRGWARALSGQPAAGLAEFEAAFERRGEIGTYEGIPVYGGMRAKIFEQLRRLDESEAILDSAIAASTRSGQVFWLPELLRQRALLVHQSRPADPSVVADLWRANAVAIEQQASVLADRVQADAKRLGLPDRIFFDA
jgi:class 3 adenylate cyclase/predicted ATPase